MPLLILGDLAYPLLLWLMKLYTKNSSTTSLERNYVNEETAESVGINTSMSTNNASTSSATASSLCDAIRDSLQ